MSVSDSSSDTQVAVEDEYGSHVAEAVGGIREVAHDTVKVSVAPDQWVAALTTARDELGLVYFSWLAGVDWTNEVEVGDPPVDEVDECFEVLCTVGDLTEGRRVTFSTKLERGRPALDSLVGLYAGANWHERECHEMFGIDFPGHPELESLYLPDAFQGHPLLKSYKLLSREVKPWPGKVDVEDMPEDEEEESDPGAPSTENPEA